MQRRGLFGLVIGVESSFGVKLGAGPTVLAGMRPGAAPSPCTGGTARGASSRRAVSCSRLGRLLGDDRTFSLAHQLANGLMLVVTLGGVAASIANVVVDGPPISTYLAGGTAAVHVGLYAWSRYGGSFATPTWMSLLLLCFVFYPSQYLGNYGIDGAQEQVGIAVAIAATSVLSGWRRASVIVATVVTTCVLFLFEQQQPGAFSEYASRESRFADVLATTILIGSALVAVFVIMQTSYERERQKARDYAAVIERVNRELEDALQKNQELALTDQLTGLPNRRSFDTLLEVKLPEAERYRRPLSLVVMDVDHFKAVNDTFGHTVGDRILADIAAIVRGQLRASDLCARWGGEELVVLCPETTLAGAIVLAERLRSVVEEHAFPVERGITVSLGVSEYGPGDDADTLFARADRALYAAKRGGRNRVLGERDLPAKP